MGFVCGQAAPLPLAQRPSLHPGPTVPHTLCLLEVQASRRVPGAPNGNDGVTQIRNTQLGRTDGPLPTVRELRGHFMA